MDLRESGFVFNYNKRLSKSKVIFKNDILKIHPNKRNNDETPLFVKCKQCEEFMDFKVGPLDMLDGKWICPICQAKVMEQKVYLKLEKENEEYLLKFQEIDKPEVCESCDGPYPDCINSCTIYND